MTSHETAEMAEMTEMAASFERFARLECEELPLYRRLTLGAAEDPEMLKLLAIAPRGQRRPNLILAAVHYLLLDGADDPLADWYPTVNRGAPQPTVDPYPEFRRFVFEHLEELAPMLASRSTQTNEVNRSCLWFAAWRAAATDVADMPLALMEVGASAGLNLLADRYRYDFGDRIERGDRSSEVRLTCELRGRVPPLDAPLPRIVARHGIDLDPIDVRDPDALRWLRACVWPEQPDRHARLDAAAKTAASDPPSVIRGDAVDEVADVIEAFPLDAHVVVMNSWTLTYLERSRREAFVAALDLIGATRTLTWVSAEHPGCLAVFRDPKPTLEPASRTLVGMVRWRDGARMVDNAATVHPHLRWMEWRRSSNC